VLTTTADDFHHFADMLDAVSREGNIVVIGSQGDIEKANTDHGGSFLTVKNIL